MNDLEEEIHLKGANGIDIGMMKLYLLLYADDIVLFAISPTELQQLLDILQNNCTRYRLTVNTAKTKIMIFRKGGRIPNVLRFTNNGEDIEIILRNSRTWE